MVSCGEQPPACRTIQAGLSVSESGFTASQPTRSSELANPGGVCRSISAAVPIFLGRGHAE
jgi:hypothetical protein